MAMGPGDADHAETAIPRLLGTPKDAASVESGILFHDVIAFIVAVRDTTR